MSDNTVYNHKNTLYSTTKYYLCSSLKDIDLPDTQKRRVLIWADGHRNVVGVCDDREMSGPYRYIVEDIEDIDLTALVLSGVSVIPLEFNPYAEVKPLRTYSGKLTVFPNISSAIIIKSCTHVNWNWESFL